MLNFRRPKRRSVPIVDELPDQVFDHLVTQSKSFLFLAVEPDEDDSAADDTPQLFELSDAPLKGDEIASRHCDNKLQTPYDEDFLESLLKGIQTSAKSAIQETGVNLLYLALGFLEWRDHAHQDRTYLAPLILIPVSLDRSFNERSNRFRYSVSHSGEEIQWNLPLAEKMKHDFGLQLPEYKDLTPEEYFGLVAEAISPKPEWQLRREAYLGFFSFSKLMMYLDLDAGHWSDGFLDQHPPIRDVLMGRDKESGAGIYARDYDVDDHSLAQQLVLPLDADSSQISAIIDVEEGKSIVIEGPPGTGKSQTITNLIAWAIGTGKTVLFVAEKLAALEVVYRNLDSVGLGPYCLELHSQKARPQLVYESLGDRLKFRPSKPRRTSAVRTSLESQRQRLNDYVNACLTPIGPDGQTAYAVFGRIAKLRGDGAEVARDASLPENLSNQKIDDCLAAFDELGRHVKEVGNPSAHLWRDFWASRYSSPHRDLVLKQVEALQQQAEALCDLAQQLIALSGSTCRLTLADLQLLANIPDSMLQVPPGISNSLFASLGNARHKEEIDNLRQLIEHYQESAKRASDVDVRDQPPSEMICDQLAKELERYHDFDLNRFKTLASAVEETLMRLEEIESAISQLSGIGFNQIRSLRNYDTACEKLLLLQHPFAQKLNDIPAAFFFPVHRFRF